MKENRNGSGSGNESGSEGEHQGKRNDQAGLHGSPVDPRGQNHAELGKHGGGHAVSGLCLQLQGKDSTKVDCVGRSRVGRRLWD